MKSLQALELPDAADRRTVQARLTRRFDEAGPEAEAWRDMLAALDRGLDVADPLYGPLVAGGRRPLVIGQFGQSLDGRIATPSGESKYLNGVGGLTHLHRLRALVDAVVVGVSTVVADDPMLSVRMVDGASPARVVIDPRGRVPLSARMLQPDGARRIIVTLPETVLAASGGIEVVRVAATPEGMRPGEIVAALAAIGLPRLLIEGGAETVSRFLSEGVLDRLHVSVAPVLVGGGRSGVTLQNVRGLADCLRPVMTSYRLGEDVVFDCNFRAG